MADPRQFSSVYGPGGFEQLADPGTTNPLPTYTSGTILLNAATASQRTLGRPSFIGQILTIYVETYVAAATILVSHAINQAGNTTLTTSAVADCITLIGIPSTTAGVLAWRVLANDGMALS